MALTLSEMALMHFLVCFGLTGLSFKGQGAFKGRPWGGAIRGYEGPLNQLQLQFWLILGRPSGPGLWEISGVVYYELL